MNVISLTMFHERIKLKQFLYLVFMLSIILIIMFILNFYKNIISLETYGLVLDNNILEISNLNKYDASFILNSKKLIIHDEEINFEIIDVLNNDDSYLIKLNLSKIYLKVEKLKVRFILKEIKLYKFIYETMKGDV